VLTFRGGLNGAHISVQIFGYKAQSLSDNAEKYVIFFSLASRSCALVLEHSGAGRREVVGISAIMRGK